MESCPNILISNVLPHQTHSIGEDTSKIFRYGDQLGNILVMLFVSGAQRLPHRKRVVSVVVGIIKELTQFRELFEVLVFGALVERFI